MTDKCTMYSKNLIHTSTPKDNRNSCNISVHCNVTGSKRKLNVTIEPDVKRLKTEVSDRLNYSNLLNEDIDDFLNISDEAIIPLPNESQELFFDKNTEQVKDKIDNNALSNCTYDAFNGISRLFNETQVPEWNKVPEQSFTESIREKLLNNLSISSNFSFCKRSGWTQADFPSQLPDGGTLCAKGPFFGLPVMVQDLIEEHKGIKELYDWQIECLNLEAIKFRKNLVYALPTSGGKTLVAEILILQELVCRNKNVLFILPFVSIVQEKIRSLAPFALSLDFLVEEYAAGKGCLPLKKRRRKNSVIIATIEKALAVVESLIEEKRLNEFGLVVVDELHLLAETSGRGAILETLLTYIMFSKEEIHIIGMSATIGNLPEVARFLNAETYCGDFRPVALAEFVKCGNEIYTVNGKEEENLVLQRTLPIQNRKSTDPDGISLLVSEIVPSDSVLVFCSTKKNCENVVALLCNNLPKSLLEYRSKEKLGLLQMLQSDASGKVCHILRNSIPYGVVYHHSGLTSDERRSLEDAFREGVISVICCTSTLAAGVNLPARRVILRAPYIARDFITLSRYKQMIGRAGRAGFVDNAGGESFLVCKPSECQKVGALLRSKIEDIVSRLDLESCRTLILSAIGLQIANTRQSLRDLLSHSLLFYQSERLQVNVKAMTDQCITQLYKEGAIKADNAVVVDENNDISNLDVNVTKLEKRTLRIFNSSVLSVSRLGQAAIKGCMNLETALRLYNDLIKAESSLVLLCHLHILFIITPYELADQVYPNYSVYFDVFSQLSSKELHAAHTIGLSEKIIMGLITGQKSKKTPELLLKRFYLTLILNEMWKQQGVWDVANLFQVPRGFIQTLMTSSSTFASNVLRFCEALEELWCFKAILTDFVPRLAHCCEPEILPLMDLPAIKKARARQLVKAGFKTLQSIAQADPKTLTSAIENLPKKQAGQIIAAAKLQLLEKVENLKDEAENVLEGITNNVVNLF